jgi:hypothetical protein
MDRRDRLLLTTLPGAGAKGSLAQSPSSRRWSEGGSLIKNRLLARLGAAQRAMRVGLAGVDWITLLALEGKGWILGTHSERSAAWRRVGLHPTALEKIAR